jgi:hypothetical protein
VIRLLRRIWAALAGESPRDPEPEPAERLDAAHQRLKETIPPRED